VTSKCPGSPLPSIWNLAQSGFVRKQKVGRSNYYINVALNKILLAKG